MEAGYNRHPWHRLAASTWTLVGAGSIILLAILVVSLQRTVLGVGVESDFTGVFGREAQRILQAEPLLLPNHPPGYAIVVALGHLLTGDWLRAGLWISAISALVFMLTAVAIFRRLAGPTAAWGALLAFACSTPFLVHASLASSDMFFAALVYVLLALIVAVLASPGRIFLWAAAGAVAACVLLTRTNGLAAAAVLLLPLLVTDPMASRLRNLGAVNAGFVLPLLGWAAYATVSGSAMTPTDTYLNLAVAAYGDEAGTWGEQMFRFKATMHDLGDVLAHDPAQLARRFAENLALLPVRAARSLTWMPIALLAVPGLAIMLLKHRSLAFFACLFIVAGASAIPGILGFHARFHLTLVPFLGAMAGVAYAALLDRLAVRESMRAGLAVVVLAACTVVALKAQARVMPLVEVPAQREFAESIPVIRRETPRDATLVARNPNLTFETGRHAFYLPDVDSVADLRAALCRDVPRDRQAFLYLGGLERRFRPELAAALDMAAVDWLEPRASGSAMPWTLQRIRLDRAACEPGAESTPGG